MPLARLVAVLAGLAVACSGSSAGSGAGREPASQPPVAAADAAAEPAGTEPVSPEPLTRADCEALVAHIVDLAVKEDAAQHPELPPPADEELDAMRAALFDELEEGCVGHERGVYDCAMRAQTRREIEACEGSSG